MDHIINHYSDAYISQMERLKEEGMFRSIPSIENRGKWIYELSLPEGQQSLSRPLQNHPRPLLNLSSNDYLGILGRKDLIGEFLTILLCDYENNGGNLSGKDFPYFSAASSRLLTGNSPAYHKLEALLCKIFHKEAALIYNSGYHANTGILSALCNKDSLIIADKLVHASIIDGIKLSGCRFERFRHNDCNHLETIIKKEINNYQSMFIVTESIFSMGGDHAPLQALVALKRKYPQIILYVDEAHAFGVTGRCGLGLSEQYGVLEDIDILVGTFGKAISSVGAFIVCTKVIREFLVNKSRSLIFSTALPPINIEWSRFIIEKLTIFTKEREHLLQTSEILRNGLKCTTSNSHIMNHITGDTKRAAMLSQKLKENGIYALPVRPPTVPQVETGIRFSLTASITLPEVETIIKTVLTT